MAQAALVAQSPAAALFGLEVADSVSKNKNLLSQCGQALRANGVSAADPIPAVGETPIDTERRWAVSLQAACEGVKAWRYLQDGGAVNCVKIVALAARDAGNAVSVTVAAGSTSGKKVTISHGVTDEVYDNLADVDAVIAAIHGVSAFADAVKVANGTLANIAKTALTGGVAAINPSFSGVSLNDGQSQAVALWGKAIFDALRTAGYIA